MKDRGHFARWHNPKFLLFRLQNISFCVCQFQYFRMELRVWILRVPSLPYLAYYCKMLFGGDCCYVQGVQLMIAL